MDNRDSLAERTDALPAAFATATVTRLAAAPQPAPGALLAGRYELLRRLGEGGMGTVYEATDRELARKVAIKVIKSELAKDDSVVERFKQELVLARQVTHRNVIRIFDLGAAEGVRFITMEYVEGRDLAVLLKDRKKLPPGEAVALVKQICDGLIAAHEEGVIHRDLKPSNVMVDAQGRAFLMDFGLARTAQSSALTQTGAVVGTPVYMSPEQAKGKAVDARSDLYSLGIIFYELLTGAPPFLSDNVMAMLLARCEQKPRPPIELDPAIPKPLNDLVLKALSTDPDRRFGNAREFRLALDAYAPDAQSTRSRKSSRRLTGVDVAALAVAAVSLATAAYLFIVPRRGDSGSPKKAVSVLVADFDNATSEDVFNGTLEPVFMTLMEGASFVNAYRRETAHTVAEQLKPGTAKLNESMARLIAAREGINVVVTGVITRHGDGYRLTVNAIDGLTGKTIVSRDSDTVSKDQVLSAAAKMAPKLRRAIGDSTPEAQQLAAEETFTSTSLEAAHDYGEAQQEQWAGNSKAAIELYLKAIQDDPNFGRAYAGVAALNKNIGRRAEAEKYYKLALERSGLMTDRERLRTRGGYFLYLQDPQAIPEWTELVKLYPTDTAGLANLALAYFYARDWRNALIVGKKSTELEPKNVVRRGNVGFYELFLGETAAAAADAKAAIALNPKYPKGYIVLALSQLLDGHAEEAAAAYRQLQSISPLGSSMAIEGLGDIALAEGKFRDAESILEGGIAADSADPGADYSVAKLLALAEDELALSRKAQAASYVDRALKLSHSYATLFTASRLLARLSQDEKARAVAQQLEAEPAAEPRGYAKLIAGEIALSHGNPAEAIAAFKEAQQLTDTWIGHFDLGLAYLQANAPADADSEFDTALRRRGEATTLFLDDVPTYRYLPDVFYYKGRAAQALSGDRSPAALDWFKRFLALKTASQDDALVANARQQVDAGGAH